LSQDGVDIVAGLVGGVARADGSVQTLEERPSGGNACGDHGGRIQCGVVALDVWSELGRQLRMMNDVDAKSAMVMAAAGGASRLPQPYVGGSGKGSPPHYTHVKHNASKDKQTDSCMYRMPILQIITYKS
jgi:hypothetical protein